MSLRAAVAAVLLPGLAWATDVRVAVDLGALRPGAEREVTVAALGDGAVPAARPEIDVTGGAWRRLPERDAPGRWTWAVSPPPDVEEIGLSLRFGDDVVRRVVPVAQGGEGVLKVGGPAALAGEGPVDVWVSGDPLPSAQGIVVALSEGRVADVVRVGERLRLRVVPDAVRFPRPLVVGVSDPAGDAMGWGTVELRTRPDLELDVDEPGTQVTIVIGGRTYGPFVAGADRTLRPRIVQRPGERSARFTVVDPFGATTTVDRPMSTLPGPRLVGLVSAPRRPGERGPDLILHATTEDGRPWRRSRPACRAPRMGTLPIVRIGSGTWRVRLPIDGLDQVWEVRVRCDLDGQVEAALPVPLDETQPVQLVAKVWPEVLSTDLPVADISVSLVNGLGDRQPMVGRVTLEARLGVIRDRRVEGPAVRAEYRGDVTVEIGDDEVQAGWYPPPGDGPVDRIEVVGGPMRGARGLLHVRLLDRHRLPLGGRVAAVNVGGRVLQATTDALGWATVEVATSRPRAVVATVEADGRRVSRAALAGVPGPRGPGRPDLEASASVKVDPGRVAEIDLSVSPRRVVPGPRTRAVVRAELLDRTGLPANTEAPDVLVSEGRLEPQGRGDDGAWTWLYAPPPGYAARRVLVTVRSDALDVEERVTLDVRPEPVRRWFGVNAGVQTNFGRVTSPYAGFDAAWYIKVGQNPPRDRPGGRSQLMVRTGIGWYGAAAGTEAPGGVESRLRMDLVPIQLVLQLRQALPAMAYWFGLGGMVVPFHGVSRFEEQVVVQRGGVLPPGLVLTAGYGLRVPGGEFAVEVKGTVLNSPGSEVSFAGQVGGLTATLGYRVVY